MRKDNERRLKELGEIYLKKKINGSVGMIIREKMGFADTKSSAPQSPKDIFNEDREGLTFGSPD